MVQGILKRYSRSSPRILPTNEDSNHNVQDVSPKPKRVSFDGAEPAKVFQADEWDRSPAAVTLKLTYKSVSVGIGVQPPLIDLYTTEMLLN